MTREEHISNLETIGCDGWTVTTEAYKSLQFAIKALEQEPCEDATLKDIFCMGCEYREQEPKTGWIPVTEKLPEEDEDVLVWYEYFRYGDYNCMWQTYGIGWQCDGRFNVDNGGAKQRVIAWMPLPEPYKESEG